MTIRRFVKWVLYTALSTVLVIAILVGAFAFTVWYQNKYKNEIQTIKMVEEDIQFVLLTDISGFEDRAWYVYRTKIDEPLTSRQKEGSNTENVLFWNYAEAGEQQENPSIRVVNDKYLVFNRGGLDHSLYDIIDEKVIVNVHSTFGQAVGKPDISVPHDELDSFLHEWAYKHLHLEIQEYIGKQS